MKHQQSQYLLWRASGAVITASLLFPVVGCGSKAAPPAPTSPVSAPPGIGSPSAVKPGLTTKNKLVLLAGAAALYYYYNRSKNANAGKSVQYYRARDGRIYYNDPKTKQAIFVTGPNVSVSPEEASQYSGYQGYNNAPAGLKAADIPLN